MFKSLAKQAPYLAGVGVAINAKMKAWNGSILPQESVHIVAWDGDAFITVGGIYRFKDACFPAEVDENSFVRDGVRYVATDEFKGTGCTKCDLHIDGLCIHPDGQRSCSLGGGVYITWKRAEKKMRPMTPKECALLPHGTMFRYGDEKIFYCSTEFVVGGNCASAYCLPADLTDDIVSSPWKPLEKEITE